MRLFRASAKSDDPAHLLALAGDRGGCGRLACPIGPPSLQDGGISSGLDGQKGQAGGRSSSELAFGLAGDKDRRTRHVQVRGE